MTYVLRAMLGLLALTALSGCTRPAICFSGAEDRLSPLWLDAPAGAAKDGGGLVVIDSVDGRAPAARTEVPANARTVVRGWAVDTKLKTAAQVLVSVDGGNATRRADSCGARTDVATEQRQPGYAKSGFEVRIPPLHRGIHRLTFATISLDGRTFTPNAKVLTVIGRGADAARALAGSIERINGTSPARTVVQRRDGDVRIAGWLAEDAAGGLLPLRALDILIDGRRVDRATYGRRDGPGLIPAGYSSRFPADALSPGRHQLTLRALFAGGGSGDAPDAVTLDVVSPRTASPGAR